MKKLCSQFRIIIIFGIIANFNLSGGTFEAISQVIPERISGRFSIRELEFSG